MAGMGKKAPAMTPQLAALVFDGVSKACLIDALWCACQLGTDESSEQIMAKMARETQAAIEGARRQTK